MILVSGKEVSNKIKDEIAIEVEKLKNKGVKTKDTFDDTITHTSRRKNKYKKVNEF